MGAQSSRNFSLTRNPGRLILRLFDHAWMNRFIVPTILPSVTQVWESGQRGRPRQDNRWKPVILTFVVVSIGWRRIANQSEWRIDEADAHCSGRPVDAAVEFDLARFQEQVEYQIGQAEILRLEDVMGGTVIASKVLTHPYFSLLCFFSACFLLPQFSGVAVMLGCAGVLTALVAALPDRFRSRSGSIVTATCLVAVMWVAAAVVTALALMGEIRS